MDTVASLGLEMDLDAVYKTTFLPTHQEEKYRAFGNYTADRQVQHLLTAALQNIGSDTTVIDYGAGYGALIPAVLATFRDKITRYICVNHAGERGPSGKEINTELQASVEEWAISPGSSKTTRFSYCSDADLIHDIDNLNVPLHADVVFCMDVLHHIPLVELPKKLASLIYHLKTDGHLIIGTTGRPTFFETGRFWWDDAEDIELLLQSQWIEPSVLQCETQKEQIPLLVVIARKKCPVETSEDVCAMLAHLTLRAHEIYEAKLTRRIHDIEELGSAIVAPLESDGSMRDMRQDATWRELLFQQMSYRDTLKQLRVAEREAEKTGTNLRPVLHPDDRCVMLTFRQTLGGKEMEVYDKLTQRVSQGGRNGKVFFTLGQYDIVTLEEFTDLDAFRRECLITPPVEHVFNNNAHACFAWAPVKTSAGAEITVTKGLKDIEGPLVGVCFVKIHPEHIRQYGIHAESSIIVRILELVQEIQKKSECSVSVLGSFGWAEFVLLISAKSPTQIYEIVSQVRDLPCPVDPDRGAALLTSFTLLSFEKEHLPQVDQALGGMDMAIGISTEGGMKATLRQALARNKVLSCGWHGVLGKLDFIGIKKTAKGTVGEILQLRSGEHGHDGALTTTCFPLIDLQGSDEVPPFPPTPRVDQPPEREFEYDKKLQECRQTPSILLVRQALSQYVACATDPYVRPNVLDMQGFMHAICEAALKSLSKDDADITEHAIIYNAARRALLSLKQRYTGTYDTIYNLSDVNTSGMTVGIQRLVLATEALVSPLLKRYHRQPWRGFVMYAQDLQAFRDNFGVFNLPGEKAFDLRAKETLWYLHEIGHELAADMPNNMLEDGGSGDIESTEQRRDMQREILADLFLLAVGFRGNLGDYFQTMRPHFHELLVHTDERIRIRYITRLFAAYAYAHVTDPKEYDADRVAFSASEFFVQLKQNGYELPEFEHPGDALHFFVEGKREDTESRAAQFESAAVELGMAERVIADAIEIKKAAKTAGSGSATKSGEMEELVSLRDSLHQRVDAFHLSAAKTKKLPQDRLAGIFGLVARWKTIIYKPMTGALVWRYPVDQDFRFAAEEIKEGRVVTHPLVNWERVVAEYPNAEKVSVRSHVAMILSLWHTWVRWTNGKTVPTPSGMQGE